MRVLLYRQDANTARREGNAGILNINIFLNFITSFASHRIRFLAVKNTIA